ncbi:hypothetical protein SAMN02745136_01460 [Anaerocolumna jejuensis DSM 15929]|uniref:Cof subfamily of IIB subfamily of haloacid dehalogenase superfamily/HAD-superfamily hydrolase, subfamily IIB n=1 Tax=Anaerocolumna jejuensis DSM 15929 TaxID=1121322 RepID=A0A1M6NUS1_9FIRM|nr:Cof-type HAD-IIB family hydrolase [Anaerocolumna jejuensis]SHJ99391.1 hypothetical protein SAMN02745136_01460 [Anaerocolumna jejuensis DSM 15929]
MIKVIASDIDGTLLNREHRLSLENKKAIMRARESGIMFLISTGRKYKDAITVLESENLADGYITLSGAQTISSQGELLSSIPLTRDNIFKVMKCASSYPVSVILNTIEQDYMIGNQLEMEESLRLREMALHEEKRAERETGHRDGRSLIQMLKKRTVAVSTLDTLFLKGAPVYKLFIIGSNQQILNQLDCEIRQIPDIASASSYITNLEITHAKAQKGLVLRDFIEQRGYKMKEVMTIGDSMNDYSMISMDYGVTVAMENAMEQLKKAAKYVTTDCDQHGVAYAINCLLDGNIGDIRKK